MTKNSGMKIIIIKVQQQQHHLKNSPYSWPWKLYAYMATNSISNYPICKLLQVMQFLRNTALKKNPLYYNEAIVCLFPFTKLTSNCFCSSSDVVLMEPQCSTYTSDQDFNSGPSILWPTLYHLVPRAILFQIPLPPKLPQRHVADHCWNHCCLTNIFSLNSSCHGYCVLSICYPQLFKYIS